MSTRKFLITPYSSSGKKTQPVFTSYAPCLLDVYKTFYRQFQASKYQIVDGETDEVLTMRETAANTTKNGTVVYRDGMYSIVCKTCDQTMVGQQLGVWFCVNCTSNVNTGPEPGPEPGPDLNGGRYQTHCKNCNCTIYSFQPNNFTCSSCSID